MQEILFYIFAAIAIASGIAMVAHRNPVYSAIFLIVSLFSIAGFFVLLNAPFVAAIHIIVYAGAIMVLFLFVIMLLNLKRDSAREGSSFPRRAVAVLLALVLLAEIAVLTVAALQQDGTTVANGHADPASAITGSTTEIGSALFSTYLLPFEIASILILVGIIGAVILGKRKFE